MVDNKKARRFFVVLLIGLMAPVGLAAAESVSLIADPTFHSGAEILAPEQGAAIVVGETRPPWHGPEAPQWTLRQWDSRFNFAEAEETLVEEGVYRVVDQAKWVVYGAPDTPYADITMGMDSRIEWRDGPRERGQPWPHLLLGQGTASRSPTLAEMAAVDFRVSARLLQGERFEPENYHRSVHAAEFAIMMTLQNRNRDSDGYGDFLWFAIQLYDDRYPMTPERLIEGDAGHSKFIYQPGLAPYTDQSLHDGDWVHVERDLLPMFLDALEKAWERGFLPDSQDLNDYRIGRLGLGWEVPGVNLVEMQVRDLRCEITLKTPEAAGSE